LAVGIATIAAYWPARWIMADMQSHKIWVSNLSVNMIMVFGIWGASSPWISCRLWNLRRKNKVSEKNVPAWFRWTVLAVVVLGLVYYMTLWGMETRW